MRTNGFAAIHRAMRNDSGQFPTEVRGFAVYDEPAGGAAGGEGGDKGGGSGGDKTYTQAELDAALAGIKSKNSQLIGEVRTLSDYKKVAGDLTPEQIAEAVKAAKDAADAKHRAEGNFETLKGQLIEEHKKELGKVTERSSKIEKHLEKTLVTKAAADAIRALGGEPDLLLPHVTGGLKVVEDGDEFVARVVDTKGNVRIADAAGTPMTIEQFVETFKADTKYQAAFAPSGKSGSGASNSTGTGGGASEVTISNDDAKDTAKYRAAKAQAEKLGVPLRVVS